VPLVQIVRRTPSRKSHSGFLAKLDTIEISAFRIALLLVAIIWLGDKCWHTLSTSDVYQHFANPSQKVESAAPVCRTDLKLAWIE
jgi:hypothetical protein